MYSDALWRYDAEVRRKNARRYVGERSRMGESMYENKPVYFRFCMYSDALLRYYAEVGQNNLRRYVGWRVGGGRIH